jgi:hypothetical protein
VLRGLKRRLDRLWTAYQREKSFRDKARNRRSFLEHFVKATRSGLSRAGIDPATVPAMRLFAEDGFLAKAGILGPRPEPAPRPPPRSPVEKLREELLSIVRRCREEPLDLNKATPFELFAIYAFVPDAPGVAYFAE